MGETLNIFFKTKFFQKGVTMVKRVSHERKSLPEFILPLLLTTIFMFAFGLAGATALPDYINGTGVDSVVIGFVVKKGYGCIWAGFPQLQYTVKNVTFVIDNFYPYAICGDYQEAALYNVQQSYPLASILRLWYLNNKPGNLASSDPTMTVYIMIFCWGFGGLCLLSTLIIHLVGVCCYGTSTCFCKESNTIRYRDI
jgi:hypothetical protein